MLHSRHTRCPALLTLILLSLSLGACDEPAPPNLLIVSLDTVRTDRLGLYGYDRPTSPHLDALAGESVVFDQAITQAVITGPSHSTLLTGLYPPNHGVWRNGVRLDDRFVTLAEQLQDAGWQTAGFVGGLPMADSLSGLAQGFEIYDDAIENGQRRVGDDVVERALAWLAKPSDAPRFTFVHLYDAHGPYHPPEPWAETFVSGERGPWAPRVPGYQRRIDPRTGGIELDLRPYLDAYDAAIRHVDELVGRLLAAVDLERTIVLIVSDHGETLDEETRRYFPLDHGGRPYEEQSRAVAVLAAPDLAPRRIAAQVGLVDLAPTLYPLLGVEAPEPMDGIDLGPLLRGESDRGKRAEFTTASALDFIMKHTGRQVDESRPVHSVRIDGYKLIVYPGVDGEDFVELYALDSDPDEAEDLAATDPERVTNGLALLDRWDGRRHDARPPIELDPEVRERLESLGYVF